MLFVVLLAFHLSLPVLGLRIPSFIATQTVLQSGGNDDNQSRGWIDPRINGGRLLDVCPLCSLRTVDSFPCVVVVGGTRGTTQCYHICQFRSIRPLRRRIQGIQQVRITSLQNLF